MPFLQSPFNETEARFSPDGHWGACVSNETGSNEVYVTRFPGPAGKWPISSAGGSYPRWRVMDASSTTSLVTARWSLCVNGQGSEFAVEGEHRLFATHINAGGRSPYDVSPDGQRFLVNTVVEAVAPSPITLVVNWAAALQAK